MPPRFSIGSDCWAPCKPGFKIGYRGILVEYVTHNGEECAILRIADTDRTVRCPVEHLTLWSA